MSLTFAGEAAQDLAYPAYNALKNIAPTFAALADAAEAAAVAGLIADGALLIGAGLAGYAIGEAILAQLRPATYPLDFQNAWSGGAPGTRIRVLAHSITKATGRTDFDNTFDAPIVCPVFQFLGGTIYRAGVIAGNPASLQGYVSGDPTAFIEMLTIDSVETVGGSPNPTLFKQPTLPLHPEKEAPKLPAIVPFPGYPDGIPITPTVVPNPNNNPDDDDTATQPGVIVKIPETGMQFEFTPNGVRVGKYSDPTTKLFEIPKIPPPPTTPKVATEPCPCPESKVDLTEVLCRLKALENGLLSDGFEYTPHTFNMGNGGNIDELPDELVGVKITVSDSTQPIKKERASGTSSEVWYAGWTTFRRDGSDGIRTPINYRDSFIAAPEGSNGFGVSISYGGTCVCTAITRKPKPFADNC